MGDNQIWESNIVYRELGTAKRETDIITDQTKNELLQQLLMRLHNDATITPVTQALDQYTLMLPKEEDDSFSRFYNEDAYMKFKQSLILVDKEERYFYNKQSWLWKQYLHQEQSQGIQLRQKIIHERHQQHNVLQQ